MVAIIGAKKKAITVKSPIQDWFYKVVKSDDESGNDRASSDIVVNIFGHNVFEGTNPEDLGIISQIWLICNNVFERADQLLSTLVGSCQNEAPVGPVVYPEALSLEVIDPCVS